MDDHSLECLDFARVREIVAGYASTGLGRGLAETIRPNTRPELIRRWLGQVVELSRLAEQRGLPPFGGITDVRGVVRNCAPPLRISVDDMALVGDTLAGTHELTRYFADLPDEYTELRHVAERVSDFQTIVDRIRAVIDERSQVRDDASPKLGEIRKRISDAAAAIEQTVQRLLREPALRRLLQFPNHTFHNDRLVLPLKTENRGRLPGIVHRTSDSGATLYIEPAAAVELNNQISNLRSEEQEEINRLLWELAHEVHLNSAAILKTLDTIAVVDLIAAKVRFARDFELRCPEITDDGVLKVRCARHPLLIDLARQKEARGEAPDPVVPIDYRLGDDFDMLIVTGPNTGGKTVALKTIGLLCLMVQAGLPVPVGEGSSMGLFVNVLIDVGDEQSMQQSLSTFSGHLKRLMEMLRRAGERTIVLIDELGAGTDPDEGAAIGRAILDELLRLRCRCMVTTHLGSLKSFALTRERAENCCVEFDNETLKPTYHLRIGEPGESNAIAIARRLGMPRRLIVAATRNLSRKGRALRAALAGTATSKRKAEEARTAAESARLQADRAATQANDARAELERRRADFEQWVGRVVHLRPGDPVRVRNFDRDGRIVRIRLEQQRAEVDVGAFAVEVPLGDVLPPMTPAPPPRPQAPARPAEAKSPERGAERDGKRRLKSATHSPPARRPQRREPSPGSKLPPLTDAQAAALEPGDRIYVKRFHRDGTIVRLKPVKRLAILTVGMLEIEVPYEGLALSDRLARREAPASPKPAPPKRAEEKDPKHAESQSKTDEEVSAAPKPDAPASEHLAPVETIAAPTNPTTPESNPSAGPDSIAPAATTEEPSAAGDAT
ncbi:MAG: DNA strand exchange inhibitor protein [Planctomycetes bacterium]|nr:DNA strand exchange inhibitor protein [Planctomycetota bacterium]